MFKAKGVAVPSPSVSIHMGEPDQQSRFGNTHYGMVGNNSLSATSKSKFKTKKASVAASNIDNTLTI